MRALIIGCGTVGSNLAKELSPISPDVYDTHKDVDERHGRYDVAFVCVDTPLDRDELDVTDVERAVFENEASLFVIKSTLNVGDTDRIASEYGKRVVFSPEYYGSTQHCNNFSFDFTILGGDGEDCAKVVQVLQNVYDGRHRFVITDARTAELAKLMENAWIATKVSFCNQMCDIADDECVRYEELRELFLLDPRVGPSHTFVYRDRPYWDSHCLNKDVPALAGTHDAPLIDAVISFNEGRRQGVLADSAVVHQDA